MSEQNGEHSPRKVGGDAQQSTPASEPLRQLLDIAAANVRPLGLWLLFPLGGFIVLIYAVAEGGGNGGGGLHAVTGVLTLLISIAAALVPLTPRVKEVQRGWLIVPLAGAVLFLYLVNQDLNDSSGGGSWWIGLLVFAATIYVALTPQIHSFGWTDLGAAPDDTSAGAAAGVPGGYDIRMRAIARFTARTITFTAIVIVIAGVAVGYALGEDLGSELGFYDGARAVGAVLGFVGAGILAQFWLGFATIVWFTADIARHTRMETGMARRSPSQSSSAVDAPVEEPS